MAATGYSSWADLNSELLVSIAAAAGLSLRDYHCLRGVCRSWRSALRPPYPCLLSLAEAGRSASVFSLPLRSSFHLRTSTLQDSSRHHRSLSKTSRVVGSSNGCFAVQYSWTTRIFLVDPRAGEEVEIAGAFYPAISKLVFAPNSPPPGRPDGWTVVALYHGKKVACMDTRNRDTSWEWRAIDVVPRNTAGYLADLAMDAGGGKVYCLDSRGGVHVLRITRGSVAGKQLELAVAVEPLPTLMLTPVPAAFPASFAAPHDISSAEDSTKHLFFCHGSLYQVCKRNDDGCSCVCSDKITLLRYDPARWPCWEVASDLGGWSVFVSTASSPVVVRPAGGGAIVTGVRADCVYWISSKHVAMVCDVATGTSEPLVGGPHGARKGCCWYFNDDNMMGINGGESNYKATYMF